MVKIKSIKAKEILNSSGNPTVEVDLITDKGLFQASVPSGVSKGKYEAVELRDGERRYGGMGVLKAVKNVNEKIAPKLIGKDPTRQKEIDELMVELDGTENKSNLGTNAILPVSIAVCRAGAKAKNLSLYKYLSEIYTGLTHVNLEGGFPSPCLLLVEGGLHAGGKLAVQEFMVVLEGEVFKEQLRRGVEVYYSLKEILRRRYGTFATNVGLEGGFAVPVEKSEEVINLIMEAIKNVGHQDKIKIILDIAASHFYKEGVYQFEGNAFTREGLMRFYSDLIKSYPILGIEDPFSEDDWEAWEELNSKLQIPNSKFFVIGDDLTVSNLKRIKEAKAKKACSGVTIKPNQIGTVSETLEAAKKAKSADLEIFVKHRGGETNDDFVADLAVGIGAKYIMAGAPCRGERVVKYNRLLKIEEELSNH